MTINQMVDMTISIVKLTVRGKDEFSRVEIVLADIAINCSVDWRSQDRFQRLITTLRQGAGVRCVCVATLRFAAVYSALPSTILAKDVLGRRFTLEGHPRLEAIAFAPKLWCAFPQTASVRSL